MSEFPSIVHEFWQAFAAERKNWDIALADIGAYVATDRKRYLSGDEFVNPIDATSQFVSETFPARELAAYFIGMQCVNAAMIKTGIIHADA